MARVLRRLCAEVYLKFLLSSFFVIAFYLAASEFFCPTIHHYRHEKIAMTECIQWRSSESILQNKTRKKPRINLNPNKFLLPLLYNGPNNQLWGLRQAAYLAIVLNRTLVMPFFHKHITDESGPEQNIDANHRFRVDVFSDLLSVTSLKNYRDHCGKHVGAVFQASTPRSWMVESLKKAEEELDISFLHRQVTGELKKSKPFLPGIHVENAILVSGDERNQIQSAYKSDEACALYAFPFREIKLKIKRNVNDNEYKRYYNMFSISHNDVPAWSIFNALVLSTQAPKYIEEFTNAFLNYSTRGKPYLALHWRYDMEDFHKFMCDKKVGVGNQNQAQMCDRVYEVTPEKLAKSMSRYIKSVNKNSSLDIQTVYVATPQTKSSYDFLRRLEKVLLSDHFNVISHGDIERFAQEVGLISQCEFLRDNFNDFLALTELEICARSRVFLRSTYSSWTDTVILNRELVHRDVAIRKYDKQAIQIQNII